MSSIWKNCFFLRRIAIVLLNTLRSKYFLIVIRRLFIKFPNNQIILAIYYFYDPNNHRRRDQETQRDITVHQRGIFGELVELHLNEHVDYRYFFQGFFDLVPNTFIKSLGAISEVTFIDVGANVGLVSIPIGVAGYETISFEPVPRQFERFQRSISLNPNLKINLFRRAVTSSELRNSSNLIELYIPAGNSGATSSESTWSPGKAPSRVEIVETTTLDEACLSILNRISPKKVLIKIDVEGMELEVLQGAFHLIKQYKPSILMEWKNNDSRSPRNHTLLNLLNKISYSVQVINLDRRGGTVLGIFDPTVNYENILLSPLIN